MLHLLPIRLILWALASVAAISLGGFLYAGWTSESSITANVSLVIRWAGSLVTICAVLLFAAWRWIAPLQLLIFPYLGGKWEGTIEFQDNGQEQTRSVKLEVKHRLTGIIMLLESAEAASRTLLVHAERDLHFERYKLYYVYLNERKEGTKGGGERYQGIAIMRVKLATPMELKGDYFTEANRSGTLSLRQVEPNQWWKLWR